MTTKAEDAIEPNVDEVDEELPAEEQPGDGAGRFSFDRLLAKGPSFQAHRSLERLTKPFGHDHVFGLAAAAVPKSEFFEAAKLATSFASAAIAAKPEFVGACTLTNSLAAAAVVPRSELFEAAKLATSFASAAKPEFVGACTLTNSLAAAVGHITGGNDFTSMVGLGRTAATVASLAEAAVPHKMLSATMGAFDSTKLLGFHSAVLGLAQDDRLPRWDAMREMARSIAGTSVLAEQVRRMSVVDRALGPLLPELSRDLWSTHWKLTGIPTLSFLGREWHRPVGLLLELSSPASGASVSWVTSRRDKAKISRAALSREAPEDSSTPVIIDCDPVCWICDSPLVCLKETIKWIGPKHGIRKRHVFPVCAACTQRELEDPGFILRSLPAAGKPALSFRPQVIRGGGTGDGKPIGHLRLVRSDE